MSIFMHLDYDETIFTIIVTTPKEHVKNQNDGQHSLLLQRELNCHYIMYFMCTYYITLGVDGGSIRIFQAKK